MFSQEDFARLGMSQVDAGDFLVADVRYDLRLSHARTSRMGPDGRTIWIKVRTVTRGDALIPELAVDENGHPYSGELSGSIEPNFDWSGHFLDGRPHGAFHSTWMGFRPGPNWQFEHGTALPLPDAG